MPLFTSIKSCCNYYFTVILIFEWQHCSTSVITTYKACRYGLGSLTVGELEMDTTLVITLDTVCGITVNDLGILGKIIEFVTSGEFNTVSVVIDTAGPT